MKRRLLVVAALVVVALLAAGGWWWRAAGLRRDAIVAALPALPDFGTATATTRERIGQAETEARSRFHAGRGLAQLSRLYHANGFLEEAVACYTILERLQPSEPRWFHRHAAILAGYGDIEPAMKLWQRVLALAPDYLPARLRVGDSELKSEHIAAATAAYQDVLQRSAANPYALLGLARIDIEAKRWDAAREKLESVSRQTDYQIGTDLLVMVYRQLGHPELAREILGSAKASGIYRDPPDPWLDELIDDCYDPYRMSLTAGVLSRSGHADQAVQLLQRAVGIAPDDVSTRFQLAMLYVQLKNLDAGRQELQQCTEIAPDFSDGWAQLSGVLAQTGDSSGSARILAEGLSHCPQSPGLHLMLARRLEQAGRPGEAINEYLTSIHYRPNEPDAYVELGNTLIKLGRTDEGLQQMRTALETDPAYPAALSVMAFASIAAKNQTEAHRWMQRVADQPRIDSARYASLLAAYRDQFGEDWKP